MKLLLLLVLVESAFLVWSLVTRCVHERERVVVRAGELLLCATLFLTGVLEWGMCYYAIVAVLAVQAAIGTIRWRRTRERPFLPGRRIALLVGNLLLYSAALFPAILFPAFTLPQPTGPHGVAVCDYTWTDESRVESFTDQGEKRALTLRVWYPEGGEGSYPLVVFSHGAFGTIDSNTSTCVELASHGYVAVSMPWPRGWSSPAMWGSSCAVFGWRMCSILRRWMSIFSPTRRIRCMS